MIDNHKHIFEIFKKSAFSINPDDIVFQYLADIEKELSDLNINFLKIREESLTVEKNDLDF